MLNDPVERLYMIHVRTYTDVSQLDCHTIPPLQNDAVL